MAPLVLPLLPYLGAALEWPLWAVCFPLLVFFFFFLASHYALVLVVPALEKLADARSAPLRDTDRLFVSVCFARSFSMGFFLCTRALPFMLGLAQLAPDPDMAHLLVGAWGSILLCHELLCHGDPKRPALLSLVVAYAIMNSSLFVFYAAVLACGNMLRCAEYMEFVMQHLFPVAPPARGLLWSYRLHVWFVVVHWLEAAALMALLTYTLWEAQADAAIIGFASYLVVAFTVPRRDLWHRVPPRVTRDEQGTLQTPMFYAIEDEPAN